ncbi:MAG: YihA family ribosome biogenesis GTP-binding protein [Deltaproteobacteria bacterium]|nr:MAG: YihA family ribosome biogenesis GTP-binding protein [Deltaproteobacteria bacterium]
MRQVSGRYTFVGSFPSEFPALGMPEIAFAGRSNVGKSSCLNRLLGSKKAARVSNTPGRTQLINLFTVMDEMVFADLPGYGFARVPDHVQAQWKDMIEGYLGEREELRLVILLVDARREPQEMDGMLLFGMREAGIPYLVVATKVDKLKKNEVQRSLSRLTREFALRPGEIIGFSSMDGTGMAELWERIEQAVA